MLDLFLSGLFHENLEWFYFINGGLDNSFFDFLMPLITNFGSAVAWILVYIMIYVLGGEFGKRVAVLGLAALFLSNVVVVLLKYAVAEPRPFLTLPNVDVLVQENGQSFPSGHTASSFAAAVIGLKYRLESKGKFNLLIYPLFVFAFMVGFSRIYIGVHYPYDVIVGALIGTICALTVLKYENKILNNRIAHLFLPKRNPNF